MRLCPKCRHGFESADWRCPACGAAPRAPSGIPLLAPELEADAAGYPQEAFELLRAAEAASFWFRSRNRIIQWALARYFRGADSLLEIGCGTGFVLEGLRRRFPALQLTGSELSSRGLAVAATRLHGAELLQMDARSIPFREEFATLGAFDVLEHIAEDEAVLREMHQALRPGGGLLVTVPQHPFLWSAVDVTAHHVRRYRRSELVAKLERADFEVLHATSFVSLALPLLVLSRLRPRARSAKADAPAEVTLPAWMDSLLGGLMRLEFGLLRAGISLPAGGSLLVVARRVGQSSCSQGAKEGQPLPDGGRRV